MIKILRWSIGLGIIIGAVTANTTTAVEVRPPLENAITRALQKPLAVNFQQTPLTEVVQRLATEAGVPLRIDTNAFRDEDTDPVVPITFTTEEQPIAWTLDEILVPLQLEYDPRGDELVITTSNQKNEVLDQRFFDVSQLVKLIEPRLLPIEVRPVNPYGLGGEPATADNNQPKDVTTGGGFFGGTLGRGFGDKTLHYKKADFRLPLKPAQHRFPAEYALSIIVQENSSGLWEDVDNVGGTMTPTPGRILIRQTEKVHQEALITLTNIERVLRDPKKFPKYRLRDNEEDLRLRAALDRALDSVFNSVSDAAAGTMALQKWMDENLRKQGIFIRVDHAVLQDEGVDWNAMTITLKPGETHRKLFFDALAQSQLSLVYFHHHYVITSLVKADEALDTMVFDVSDLPEATDLDWLIEYLYASTSGQWEYHDGVGGIASSCGISGLLFVRQTEYVLNEVAERLDDLRHPLEVPAKPLVPQRTRSIYTLPDVATATDLQTVLPKLVDLPEATWPDDAIQRVGALLIVQQTEFVHRRIETVVEVIRTAHAVKTGELTPRP